MTYDDGPQPNLRDLGDLTIANAVVLCTMYTVNKFVIYEKYVFIPRVFI